MARKKAYTNNYYGNGPGKSTSSGRRGRSKSRDREMTTPRSERSRNYSSGAASVKSSRSIRPKNEGYASSRNERYTSGGGSVVSRRRTAESSKRYSADRSVKSQARSVVRTGHEYNSYSRMRPSDIPPSRDRRVSMVLPADHESRRGGKRSTFYDDQSIGQTTISSHGLTWAANDKQAEQAITQSSTPSTDPVSFAEDYASEPPTGVLARVSRIFTCGTDNAPCSENKTVEASPINLEQPRNFQRMVDDFDNIYEGQYNAKGLRDGYGTMYYASTKDKYEGEWLSGKPHGLGKLCRGDGSGEFEGKFAYFGVIFKGGQLLLIS